MTSTNRIDGAEGTAGAGHYQLVNISQALADSLGIELTPCPGIARPLEKAVICPHLVERRHSGTEWVLLLFLFLAVSFTVNVGMFLWNKKMKSRLKRLTDKMDMDMDMDKEKRHLEVEMNGVDSADGVAAASDGGMENRALGTGS